MSTTNQISLVNQNHQLSDGSWVEAVIINLPNGQKLIFDTTDSAHAIRLRENMSDCFSISLE